MLDKRLLDYGVPLTILSMVTVPHIMVRLEIMLDYRGRGGGNLQLWEGWTNYYRLKASPPCKHSVTHR